MSATKANINWTSVSFDSTTITRVTNASFGQGGNLIKFKGDTDQYPTIIAAIDQEPHASITTADIGTVMSTFTPGLTSTLVAYLNDAKGQSGGGVIFTLSNAVFENADAQAQHAQFGSVTGTWQAYSSDGATAPLAITRF
jgi:hypothetical protein